MKVPDFRSSRRAAALIAGGVLVVGAGAGLAACASDGSGGGHKPAADAASASAPQLKVVDPYIPQPAKGGMAAGYLVVQNDSGTADRLIAVWTGLTPNAEIHQTVDNTMQKVDGIAIPPHGKGVLARGGAHIMFMGTTRELKKGDTVDVTLTFERSGPITVRVPVLGAADRPGDPGIGTSGGAGTPGTAGTSGTPGTSTGTAPGGTSEHSGHGG